MHIPLSPCQLSYDASPAKDDFQFEMRIKASIKSSTHLKLLAKPLLNTKVVIG